MGIDPNTGKTKNSGYKKVSQSDKHLSTTMVTVTSAGPSSTPAALAAPFSTANQEAGYRTWRLTNSQAVFELKIKGIEVPVSMPTKWLDKSYSFKMGNQTKEDVDFTLVPAVEALSFNSFLDLDIDGQLEAETVLDIQYADQIYVPSIGTTRALVVTLTYDPCGLVLELVLAIHPQEPQLFCKVCTALIAIQNQHRQQTVTTSIGSLRILRANIRLTDEDREKPKFTKRVAYMLTTTKHAALVVKIIAVILAILFTVAFVLLKTGHVVSQNQQNNIIMGVAYVILMLLTFAVFFGIDIAERGPTGSRVAFTNGWQSWSFCGAFQQGTRSPAPRLPAHFSKAFHMGAGRKFNGSWLDNAASAVFSEMFVLYADKTTRKGVLIGFLTQKQQFGSIISDNQISIFELQTQFDGLQIEYPGTQFTTDWAFLQLLPELPQEPLAQYADLVGSINKARTHFHNDIPVGWCSWYHYYDKLTAKNLSENLASVQQLSNKIHLDLFQIDDGYQSAWGDWFRLKKDFPDQMKQLTDQIKAAGFRPGIWLAPMSADKHSVIAKQNPQWILRNASGSPANSANCGKFFFGLDATVPQVQDFVRETLSRVVNEWGFKYVKLDFIYSTVLFDAVRKNYKVTRAQALDLMLNIIRESIGPDVFFLGCGCPIGSSIGIVDANRVSADAGPTWYPEFPLPKRDNWNLPCARNMIQNTINRLFMHKRWFIVDPDCILLRDTTVFNDDEVIGIASVIAMSGGMFLVSDNLDEVSFQRLNIARSLVPVTGKAAIPVDLLETTMPEMLTIDYSAPALGDWQVFALCNWTPRKVVKRVSIDRLVKESRILKGLSRPSDEYHVFEFWTSEYRRVKAGEIMEEIRIPAHSARIFKLKAVGFEKMTASGIAGSNDSPQIKVAAPCYIGSDIHFSCGFEVQSMTRTENSQGSNRREMILNLQVGRQVLHGSIWLYLPSSSSTSSAPSSSTSSSTNNNTFVKSPQISGNANNDVAENIACQPVEGATDVWKIGVTLEKEKNNQVVIVWDS